MSHEQEKKLVDLKTRTKGFALRIVRLYSALPQTAAAQVKGKQLLRSGTSAGAQYREAMGSRSTAGFINNVEGALQELEESSYWLELFGEIRSMNPDRFLDLQQEASELTAILMTCARNAKRRDE